ncbi:AraC family transcriptional regulator [Paenibacillus glycanilyticus]|uniref:AraC family transcriptional regulator n=1 Tax=Paenibacillus glycanilyticus TaxID=126569 RepID=UPI0019111E93|nr:AraC family transcriptional regulator [Paenibacillus glycanilyticus]
MQNRPLIYGPTTRSTTSYPGFYHWHQCCEILFIHEGNGFVIVNQKTYEMRPGMMFFFQPFQLHKVYASVSEDMPYVRTMMFFDPHYFNRALLPFRSRQAIFERLWKSARNTEPLDLQPRLTYLEQVIAMYNDKCKTGNGLVEEEDMTLLLLHILEAAASASPKQNDSAIELRPFSYVEQIMDWIEEHYAEEIHLEAIAERLHLSKSYISRIFQRETGGHLSEYITARRVKQACRLLQNTEFSVERISSEVGYPNVSYFIRLFKKVIGTTPFKYRAASRELE